MKQRISNRKLVRLPDAFLPAAMLAASVMGCESPAIELYIAWLIVACFSLFACRGLRIAFARQPAIRNVRGSVKCALLLTLFGGAVASGLSGLLPGGYDPGVLSWIGAGLLLNIEHIFYEYMYAIGDRRSATLSRALTALFMLAGIILETSQRIGTLQPFALQEKTAITAGIAAVSPFMLIAAGLSALVALAVSLVMGDGTRGSLNGMAVRCAPRAAVQTMLYPAAALALVFLLEAHTFGLAFFAGLTLYELCKTPFRRSPLEARRLNRALLFAAAGAALVWLSTLALPTPATSAQTSAFTLFLGERTCLAALLGAACVCAFALFGNINIRDD